MRNFQKEQVFTNIPAGTAQKYSVYTLKYDGQLVEYYVRAASASIGISVLINGIPLSLNIEGERIPLFYEVKANDIIEIMLKNDDVTAQSAVVMLLIQEF